jgi:hypothetical protein
MPVKQKMVAAFLLVGLAVVMIALPQHAAIRAARPAPSQNAPGTDTSLPASAEPTPKFHAEAPRGALPDTLDPTQFSAIVVQNAYIVAAKIKRLLYQQPCYCHCDQSQGHNSLLDCFASKHGSGCNLCMGEDFYTYEQSRQNKTAAQIRAGIMRGEWKTVDLNKYTLPLAASK